MEKYKILSDNIEEHLHNVIVRAALLFANKVQDSFPNTGTIDREEFLNLANNGFKIMRSKERKLYDSFAGAILCRGMANDYPEYDFLLAEPENESYDSAILLSPKGEAAKYIANGVHVFDTNKIIKLEITELVDLSDEAILKLADDKLGYKHDYKGRVLLIDINTAGKINFKRMSDMFKSKNINFKTIRLMARRTPLAHEYILVELLKDDVLIKPFSLNIDTNKLFSTVREMIS